MSQNAHIFRLHDDLLEGIFSALVLTDVASESTSPVVLSHVCRRWRFVARSSALLWTSINMNGPNPAMFFALSRDANLRVSWDGLALDGTSREWIWAHAPRFRELVLGDYASDIERLLTKYGEHFYNLEHLRLSGTLLVRKPSRRPQALSRVPVGFAMPKLVSLSLE